MCGFLSSLQHRSVNMLFSDFPVISFCLAHFNNIVYNIYAKDVINDFVICKVSSQQYPVWETQKLHTDF